MSRSSVLSTPISITGVAALLLLLGPGAAPAAAQEAEQHTLRGDRVAIHNLAGVAEITAGTGTDVIVEVRRGGSDAARLEIQTGAIEGRETLRVLYPEDRVVYTRGNGSFRTAVHVREDGTIGRGGRRVEIRGSGSGMEAHADLRILVPAGKDVAFHLGVGRVDARNVNGNLRIDVASAAVETAATRGNLSIDTGSGRVSVTDAQGDVDIDTGSGSVEVAGVTGRQLRIDTGSGSVEVNGARLESVLEIDTGSGRIRATGIAASDIRFDTGSGSIDLALTAPARDIELDAGSGSVTLRVPEGFGADVEMDTGSGGIEVDVPGIQTVRQTRDYFRGTIGDGAARVRIDTGSGRARLVRS